MSKVEEFAGFSCVSGEGLFDKTGLAVLEGEAGVGVVVGMGRGDVYEIDVGVLNEGLIAIVDAGATVALGKGLGLLEGT